MFGGIAIRLAHILDREVVAEGNETVAQANDLRSLGGQHARGYGFAKPMNPASIEALLKSGTREASLSGGLLHGRVEVRAAAPMTRDEPLPEYDLAKPKIAFS
jgi:predicted signal transduction protein with EAL and GGDEF domain